MIQFLLLLCLVAVGHLAAEETEPVKKEPIDSIANLRKVKKGYIPFSFEKKSLIAIINELAAKKSVNIILPQNAADFETVKNQTVTYEPHGRTDIPVKEAWHLLSTFLELSGFGLSQKKKDLFAVERIGKKQEPGINRSLLPIYADVAPEKLPDSQERIRYIYYLKNLKVPGERDAATNPIGRILKDMLTPDAPVVFEPKTNAIIITDKSNTIASVMHIVNELDHSGYRETIEVIHLNNTPVNDVVKIFDLLRSAAGGNNGVPFIRGDAKSESLSYFAEDTKIVADSRQNNLILMGRQSAVGRIADFVREHMDSPQETGKSVLHYYDLQYLDATQFAEVLTKVVTPLPATGAQATAEGKGGPERYFQGVIIAAEEVKKVDIAATTEEITLAAREGYTPTGLGEQQKFIGGNRLVVAALHDDWLRLKKLIREIDKPQPYVILEVMIIDIRGIKQKLVAGTTRTKTATQLPTDGFQFLSSNISDVNSVLTNTPEKLEQDLLAVLAGNAGEGNTALTSLLSPGSLIISVNDTKTPGIFGLLQILDTKLHSKILSHPYLVTTNNQKATIASQELRRRRGDATPGAAGVTTIEIVDLDATVQVQMIPRLSSLERLSLQVAVDINEFLDISSDTRITRRVNTNANMESGQILVIGGLTRIDQSDSTAGSPILSRIPIIGSFFSRKNRTTTNNNIAVLVSPTIVQPKLRGGLNVFTADKIRKARRDIDDLVIFGEVQDPVTRLFFQTEAPPSNLMRDYLSDVKNRPDAELIKTAKEKRREARRPKVRPRKPPVGPPKPGPVKPIPA